ncbi:MULTISPECIES: D-alanyl-D-alanine carboxypeptidase family protein [unclassified Ruminococcus]|uniref:M15 family metallopeptidase n=1 Tax=unclassified Ruminococcus TaxID=2608920 RepID=UPI00210BFC52|nr:MULTISPECIES: M15 family metallopeptidase [unclassified Ruminococcus]MCQ4022177.1 hypothetical protein [Ruminococcus sp. zg-924]MCQ4115575.1 hypothetical protein [Ruminococcus sp. zg-921]
MDGYEDYFGLGDIDGVERQPRQRRSEHRRSSEQIPKQREKRKSSDKIGKIGSRAFLIAVVAVIYVSAVIMMLAFSNGMGTRIKEQEEATIAANILENPVYPNDYKTVQLDNSEVNDGFLLLINNEYACRHDGIDLANVSENYNKTYQVTDYAVEANKTTIDQMNLMFADFKKAVGENDLMISCAYRSMALQDQLYKEEIEEKGEAEGSKWVTKPGHSEHQSGYAFDLTLMAKNGGITEFDGKGKYAWIKDNCEKYGFIIRYPQEKTELTGIYHEPWHIRYVGIAHACYIKENNLCLEEYISLIKGYSVQKPLEYQDCEMNRWCIYYVPAGSTATNVPVPNGKQYEISGNNVDGFIVSVKMN